MYNDAGLVPGPDAIQVSTPFDPGNFSILRPNWKVAASIFSAETRVQAAKVSETRIFAQWIHSKSSFMAIAAHLKVRTR